MSSVVRRLPLVVCILSLAANALPTTNDHRLTASWKENKQAGKFRRARFLSNAFLPDRGRRWRFHQHPREMGAEHPRPSAFPMPPQPWVCPQAVRSETFLYYRCALSAGDAKDHGEVFGRVDRSPVARVLIMSFLIRSRSAAGHISSNVCQASASRPL